MSDAVLWLGIAAFAGALAVGDLPDDARRHGRFWLSPLLGGAAAIFYEAPPDPLGLPRPR